MAKFYGVIGYGEPEEISPGVWEDVIVEATYYGDVVKASRKLQAGAAINSDISVGNSISIVADAYANEHFFAMRYVEWSGTLWTISDVEVQSPRLLLRLGGVYNGPKSSSPGTP
jgi:hypothetical protein